MLRLLIILFALTLATPALAQEGMPQGPMPVPVIRVEPRTVQTWTDYSGRLAAVTQAEIRPQVSGRIEKVLFSEGQRVTAGQPLFQIDDRIYQAAVQAAEAAYNLAKLERERAEKLKSSAAFSQGILDARKAQEATAQAQLTQARLNLEYTRVKAPFAGRVGRAERTEGNLIETQMGSPLLTTIVSDTPIYAEFNVDERAFLALRGIDHSKIPVEVRLNETNGTVYKGTLHSFDNQLDAATSTIRARAILQNPDGLLVPGMFASVKLGTPPKKQLTVPEAAIGTDQDKRFVYAVAQDNTVAYREITLGATTGQDRVVASGLTPGEQVIVSGLQRLRPGMPVSPQSGEKVLGVRD